MTKLGIKLCIYSTALLLTLACKNKTNGQGKRNINSIDTLNININYTKPTDANIAKWGSIISNFYDTVIAKKLNGQMLVAKNGVILFEKYIGTENLQNPISKPINEHSAIHLASVSKTFTAGAILLLQQQGKLTINDYVSKYLTTFPYPTVTIKMLLNHRAGLPNYVHQLQAWGYTSTEMATNYDILNYMVSSKAALLYKPDTKFLYCNTNYAMLALIIEKISGLTYPEYLRTNIFVPLRMNDTYVFTPNDTTTAILSYDYKNRKYPYVNLDGVYGDKNVYSTVRDLYKWDQALYSNQLLNTDSKESAYSGYSFEKKGIKNYGLGWRMFNFENGKKFVFHNGWWHGNNNSFLRLIQDSATIICLGNKYSKSNYSVMQLGYLFGDYEMVYDNEEKDTAKAHEVTALYQLKLRADSLRQVKKITLKKDSLPKKKDTLKMIKPKDTVVENEE